MNYGLNYPSSDLTNWILKGALVAEVRRRDEGQGEGKRGDKRNNGRKRGEVRKREARHNDVKRWWCGVK